MFANQRLDEQQPNLGFPPSMDPGSRQPSVASSGDTSLFRRREKWIVSPAKRVTLTRASRGPCRAITPRLSLRLRHQPSINLITLLTATKSRLSVQHGPRTSPASRLRPGIRTKAAHSPWPLACGGPTDGNRISASYPCRVIALRFDRRKANLPPPGGGPG